MEATATSQNIYSLAYAVRFHWNYSEKYHRNESITIYLFWYEDTTVYKDTYNQHAIMLDLKATKTPKID